MRTLGPTLAGAFDALRELYPTAVEGDAWRLLESSYRPDARFGEAFAKLLVGVLGERAPLLVDSMLPALKQAQRPWLARAVERRHEICARLGARAAEVAATGHALQVEDDRIASPLFVIHGRERRRVLWEGPEAFVLRGVDAPPRPAAALLEVIDDNPAAVTPGVLLRPVVQDATLGTALQLMGPGELAYLTQASALYDQLEVAAPHVALRPQIMVLDRKQRGHLDDLGLSLDELLRDERSVFALLDRGGPSERVEALRATTLGELDRMKREIAALDVNLERPFEKTREHIDRALELFAGKVSASAVRRDQTVRSRTEALRAACLPRGAPQERVLSVAHFILRYGLDFGRGVLDQLDVESDAVQIVDPGAAA
jgi:uncharacterized protein YllA (UPF0747 family)